MGRTTGVVLSNTSFLAASSVGTATLWTGGRAVISITADQYGGGVFLQSQGATGKWISVNGTTYSADQVTAYDLPQGQVRIISNAGSSINLQAKLLPVSYGG